MAENTGIEWATHSWNPWWGCQRVSPGCERCYAETLAVVRRKLPIWGPPKTTERKPMSEDYWKQPLRWERAAARTGERPRVFPSMCDPFEDHYQVVPWRARFFELIEATPHVYWLLLTKRPENVLAFAPASWRPRFPSNVWVGTSAEDQEWYERRIGHLARIPADVRFVSAEPLLGPIDFGFLGTVPADWGVGYRPVGDIVSWVIFGGESGTNARRLNVEWIRDGVRQAKEAGVAAFVKQLGARPYSVADRISNRKLGFPEGTKKPDGFYRHLNDAKGGDPSEWPADLRVREFPDDV